MRRIGFIGTGNLATAVLTGSLQSGRFSGKDFLLYDVCSEKTAALRDRFSAAVASSARQVAAECDVVIMAVKPKDFPALLDDLSDTLQENDPLVVSVAAGLSIGYLQSCLRYPAKLARIMTNLNAAVGEGMTAYAVCRMHSLIR